MANIVLQGLTWDHRRAIDPLLATMPGFRAKWSEVDIVWTPRPLHAFEFAPVPELARQFDLIVLDHPFMGDIAASGCLEPLDGLINAETDASFVGPSLESYRYMERLGRCRSMRHARSQWQGRIFLRLRLACRDMG